ncbi:MAG TPA: response regulator, partial [Candidatus Tectomicrobia bacterium]|nr:response regulator [Candidatus Tectomicrobia bacterium]
MSAPEPILVVDDEPDVANALGDFLVGEGFAVVVAHTGKEAVARLHEGGVGLVLLDLVLPDMDGVAVMREARSVANAPEIVIVTGHATLETAIAAG